MFEYASNLFLIGTLGGFGSQKWFDLETVQIIHGIILCMQLQNTGFHVQLQNYIFQLITVITVDTFSTRDRPTLHTNKHLNPKWMQ